MTQPFPCSGKRWFFEASTPGEHHLHGVYGEWVIAIRSPYGIIEVIDTIDYGRVLLINGRVQSAQIDEFIYHEVLVHPAVLAHPNPESALILGGGEGAVARELLRYRSIEKIVMVDIDEVVIDVAKRYLTRWHKASFEDPRLRLLIEDALTYVEKSNESFDIVVMDITEPTNEVSSRLYTKGFFEKVKAHLTNEGVFSMQAGSAEIYNLEFFCSMYKTIKSVFRYTYAYQVYIPSYVNAWGFIIASDGVDLGNIATATLRERQIVRNSKDLRYFDPELYQALLTLPVYLKEALIQSGKVYEKPSDIVVY